MMSVILNYFTTPVHAAVPKKSTYVCVIGSYWGQQRVTRAKHNQHLFPQASVTGLITVGKEQQYENSLVFLGVSLMGSSLPPWISALSAESRGTETRSFYYNQWIYLFLGIRCVTQNGVRNLTLCVPWLEIIHPPSVTRAAQEHPRLCEYGKARKCSHRTNWASIVRKGDTSDSVSSAANDEQRKQKVVKCKW